MFAFIVNPKILYPTESHLILLPKLAPGAIEAVPVWCGRGTWGGVVNFMVVNFMVINYSIWWVKGMRGQVGTG